jgi:hypothetical protein
VIAREIAGETLLVPIRGELADMQRLFFLEPVSHFIWEQLDGATTLADVGMAVTGRFDVDVEVARADLLAFIEELTDAGLVVAG